MVAVTHKALALFFHPMQWTELYLLFAQIYKFIRAKQDFKMANLAPVFLLVLVLVQTYQLLRIIYQFFHALAQI